MDDNKLIKSLHEASQSLKLLYVEDDLELCENTHAMLEDFFETIVVAHNGEDALRFYEQDSFDIVLTDIMMPKLDGRAMSRKMREINPEQAIVVMSAYEDSAYFMELIDIGISNFVPKPPSLSQLFSSLLKTSIDINNAKKVAALSVGLKQDLYESKELLRTIIDSIPVRIFWKDTQSRYLGCNQLFANDAGFKDQSGLIGKSDFELPWKDQAEGFMNDEACVMKTGESKISYEEERMDTEGNKRWVSCSKVLLKGRDDEVLGTLGNYIDITEHKKNLKAIEDAKLALSYQAYHDALTELPNRLLYLDRLEQSIKKASRAGRKVAVIFIDIDRFKEFNDSFGHELGDEIIKLLGQRLAVSLRKDDVVARFGGDEFVVLIDGFDSVNDVTEIIQKLMQSIEGAFSIGEHHLHATISMGISIYPDDGKTAKILIRNADSAMYRAKEEGRDNYQFYAKEMTEKSMAHLLMVKNIRHAIEKKEFVVYYQPQIDVSTHKVIGMEALVRWLSPKEGLIPPCDFISIAEDSGLIDKIGEYVFMEAAQQISQWYDQGLKPGRVAINISALELEKEGFIGSLEQRLIDVSCNPAWIELEITEGYMMKHPELSIEVMHKIKKLGIQLAIDDFGTGYSSLSYLQRLPIDKLKIDQSFISNLSDDSHDEAIVESIISLAKTMKFKVIAEGVETESQEATLIEKGCHEIQGYLYAKPMTAVDMEQFLKSFNE